MVCNICYKRPALLDWEGYLSISYPAIITNTILWKCSNWEEAAENSRQLNRNL